MKIKLKLTLYFNSALFQSLFDLETAIERREVYKRFIKLPITLTLLRTGTGYLSKLKAV